MSTAGTGPSRGTPAAPHSAHAAMAVTADAAPASRGWQAAVALAVVALVAAAALAGLSGGGRDLAGGWLDDDATWLAPAAPGLLLWAPVLGGLLAYAVWQLTPGAQTVRHARLRPWIALSAVVTAAWLLLVQAGLAGLAALAGVVALVVLLRILGLLETARPRGLGERLLLDGVQGLHLGWMVLMALGSLAAWLAASGVGSMLELTHWAQGLLVVATVLGALIAVYGGDRLAPALALVWGLVWVGVGRMDGTGLLSGSVALMAWGSALIVALAWLVSALLSRRSVTGEARDLIRGAFDGEPGNAARVR